MARRQIQRRLIEVGFSSSFEQAHEFHKGLKGTEGKRKQKT